MSKKRLSIAFLAAGLALTGWLRPNPLPAAAPPHVAGTSAVAAGRYLVMIQGCNDCHTAGWDQAGGKIPESKWLTGSSVGFRGPWGTSYAFNLRNYFSKMTADEWVRQARRMHSDPPMPWMSVRAMSDADLRSMYAFIHSLGPAEGAKVHSLKPGEEPTTPYIDFVPKTPQTTPSP